MIDIRGNKGVLKLLDELSKKGGLVQGV